MFESYNNRKVSGVPCVPICQAGCQSCVCVRVVLGSMSGTRTIHARLHSVHGVNGRWSNVPRVPSIESLQ